MYLAQVTGHVVATRKCDDCQGIPLLLVQPLDENQRPRGASHVAADSIGAGPGEIVYCVGARDAALAFAPRVIPVDAAVVGIVDDVHLPVRP